MGIQHLLSAGGLTLAAVSTLFLSRTFLRVGSADLWEIGAGAILGDFEVFGVRWRLVQTACRQRADSMVGLGMLLLGMVAQFSALFIPTSTTQVSKTLVFVCAALVAVCGLAAGHLCARANARGFLEAKIKEQVMRDVLLRHPPHQRPTLSDDRRLGYSRDISNLLSGLSTPERVVRFSSRLFAEIEGRLLVLNPSATLSEQRGK